MRALVSVYDKSGLVEFVERLVAAGCEVVSSGGTAAALEESGLPVTAVSDVTAAPEILGGRVKTLHPKIHGGILARGESDDPELEAHGIERFELVVCNLYPFEETLASAIASESDIIEQIDIGGPAMIRAAAKNHHHVGVVVSPNQYEEVATAIESGGLDDGLRRRLAAEALFHTASYDAAIAEWLGDDRVMPLRRVTELRYGENPHQPATLYVANGASPWWLAATQHQGKEMSFNNYADAEAAWRLATDLGHDAAVIVKHTNACGAAVGASVADSFERAWDCDPLSAFGGVVAIDGVVDEVTAESIGEKFVEVVVARGFEDLALRALSARKNLRVLSAPLPDMTAIDVRGIESGLLIQERDGFADELWRTVSEKDPTDGELDALRFAWITCAHAKSNAVVIANGKEAVGVGAGDQSRVGAAERAVLKAGARAIGAVAASDAFFPFPDGIEVLADAGVRAIVQPGGSRNDGAVIEAANDRGLSMVFTGIRHFRH